MESKTVSLWWKVTNRMVGLCCGTGQNGNLIGGCWAGLKQFFSGYGHK
ncbi:hypothetical protein Hdeb2414_s0016g00477791 [Helianthus debilis subsp. tardiflorus]